MHTDVHELRFRIGLDIYVVYMVCCSQLGMRNSWADRHCPPVLVDKAASIETAALAIDRRTGGILRHGVACTLCSAVF
jgi:hypothetical protein